MKRILIVLLGGLVLVSSCGRANRKAEEKQANVERIRVRQDSIRQVDATRMLELRLQARQDSLTMVAAMSSLAVKAEKRHASAYYVVVGSFLNSGNASAYCGAMQKIFHSAQIVHKGVWNLVCVGGAHRSYVSAAATIPNVINQVNNGGGKSSSDDEEESEDEESEDEDEESEDEEEEEEESDSPVRGLVAQAWVLALY